MNLRSAIARATLALVVSITVVPAASAADRVAATVSVANRDIKFLPKNDLAATKPPLKHPPVAPMERGSGYGRWHLDRLEHARQVLVN